MKIKTLSLLLIITAFGSFNVFSQQLPANTVGTWSGQVIEAGRSDFYTVNLKLWNGKLGEVVGSISYPDYNCGGDLTLFIVKGKVAALRERLTFGETECIDGGQVTIGFDKDRLKFNWGKEGLDFAAQGELFRQ